MESKMSTVLGQRVTATEVRTAIARARHFLANAKDKAFAKSALKEFDDARLNYRDHTTESTNDLRLVLSRQNSDLDARSHIDDALRLVALGEVASILSVLQCNGIARRRGPDNYLAATWEESDDETQESIRVDLTQEMNRVLATYGAKVDSTYGDPRGHTVHLAFSDGATNRGAGSRVYGIG
jgi:hypothetical protein